jgi:hypothetical protein
MCGKADRIPHPSYTVPLLLTEHARFLYHQQYLCQEPLKLHLHAFYLLIHYMHLLPRPENVASPKKKRPTNVIGLYDDQMIARDKGGLKVKVTVLILKHVQFKYYC